MHCPSFEVLHYGVFDSDVAFPRIAVSKERCATRFELELFTEDSQGITYVDGEPYPLRKGLFLCIKPGQLRYSRLPLRCHYLHLLTEDAQLQQALKNLPEACMLSDLQPIRAVFEELARLPRNNEKSSLLLQSTVAKLLHLLQETLRENSAAAAGVHRSQRRVLESTAHYIRSHVADSLELGDLAARAGFSPSHFHRLFSAYFGQTLHGFILTCRMDAAKAALQSDNCSMTELAAACGFSSPSHFSYQFKKAVGQTPSEYRRQMLSRPEA